LQGSLSRLAKKHTQRGPPFQNACRRVSQKDQKVMDLKFDPFTTQPL
jgi:hypothetical protein